MAGKETSEIFGTVDERSFSSWIRRKRKWIFFILFLLFVAVSGYFGYRFFLPETEPQATEPPKSAEPSRSQGLAPQAEPVTEPLALFGSANFESENFQIGDIAIGGEAEFLLSEDSPEPLEITSIRGEAFAEKNKQEMKLILTWKTNKLSRGAVAYSKGVGQTARIIEEDDYSFNHSVMISGLDQASTYVYAITAKDRSGNEVKSEQHAVYTGSKTVSLFDLIADAIGDVFGWAVKK